MNRKTSVAVYSVFIYGICAAQSVKKTSGYIQLQYNQTMYDRTKGNNPWGMGTGTFVMLQSKTAFRCMGELTADYNFVDDKVLRLNSDGSETPGVRGVVNLFAGISCHPSRSFYVSLAAGPSFISGSVRAGVKPSIGFYFSPKQKWTGRFSFCNIFNRDKASGEDFGVISFSIGTKIF